MGRFDGRPMRIRWTTTLAYIFAWTDPAPPDSRCCRLHTALPSGRSHIWYHSDTHVNTAFFFRPTLPCLVDSSGTAGFLFCQFLFCFSGVAGFLALPVVAGHLRRCRLDDHAAGVYRRCRLIQDLVVPHDTPASRGQFWRGQLLRRSRFLGAAGF